MDDTQNLFPSEAARTAALAEAEAISRKEEAMATVFQSLGMRDEKRYGAFAGEAESRSRSSAELIRELESRGFVVDKAGTRVDFTDSLGNMALTADVANTGGIGVEASSTAKGGGPGDLAREASEVELGPVGTGVTAGNRAIGSPKDADERFVVGPTETRDGRAMDVVTRAMAESAQKQENKSNLEMRTPTVENPPTNLDPGAALAVETSPTAGVPSTSTVDVATSEPTGNATTAKGKGKGAAEAGSDK